MSAAPIIMAEKRCLRCEEDWPADLEFFYKTTDNRTGLSPYCKACFAEMPSARRKGQSRTRPFRMVSSWESLFPETKESLHGC